MRKYISSILMVVLLVEVALSAEAIASARRGRDRVTADAIVGRWQVNSKPCPETQLMEPVLPNRHGDVDGCIFRPDGSAIVWGFPQFPDTAAARWIVPERHAPGYFATVSLFSWAIDSRGRLELRCTATEITRIVGVEFHRGRAVLSVAGTFFESRPDEGAPPAVREVSVITGDAHALLSWRIDDANHSNVAAYQIYRGPTPSQLKAHALVGPAAEGFLDAPIPNDTTWYYAVKAITGGGEGPPSASVAAHPTEDHLHVFVGAWRWKSQSVEDDSGHHSYPVIPNEAGDIPTLLLFGNGTGLRRDFARHFDEQAAAWVVPERSDERFRSFASRFSWDAWSGQDGHVFNLRFLDHGDGRMRHEFAAVGQNGTVISLSHGHVILTRTGSPPILRGE